MCIRSRFLKCERCMKQRSYKPLVYITTTCGKLWHYPSSHGHCSMCILCKCSYIVLNSPIMHVTPTGSPWVRDISILRTKFWFPMVSVLEVPLYHHYMWQIVTIIIFLIAFMHETRGAVLNTRILYKPTCMYVGLYVCVSVYTGIPQLQAV